MRLLDNELIHKYFGCDGNYSDDKHVHGQFIPCDAYCAINIFKAMEEPIKNGDRYLFLAMDNWLENNAGLYVGFHPRELRLPSQFQKIQECEKKESYKKCVCEHCQSEIKRSAQQALIEAEIRIKSDKAVRKATWLEAARHIQETWCRAYPESIFKEPPRGKHGKTVDECSAAMGRHMAKTIAEEFRAKAQEIP